MEFGNYLSLNHKKRRIHWSWFLCPFLEKKGRRIIAAKWKFSALWLLIQHWCWQLALFSFLMVFLKPLSLLLFFFFFPLSLYSLLMQSPFDQEFGSVPLKWRCHSTNTDALNKCIFGIITISLLALRVLLSKPIWFLAWHGFSLRKNPSILVSSNGNRLNQFSSCPLLNYWNEMTPTLWTTKVNILFV